VASLNHIRAPSGIPFRFLSNGIRSSVKKGGPGFSVLPDRGEQIAQRVADLPFRRVASANAKPN
jgi:hypothetical protein